jgi:hypothetical protein
MEQPDTGTEILPDSDAYAANRREYRKKQE